MIRQDRERESVFQCKRIRIQVFNKKVLLQVKYKQPDCQKSEMMNSYYQGQVFFTVFFLQIYLSVRSLITFIQISVSWTTKCNRKSTSLSTFILFLFSIWKEYCIRRGEDISVWLSLYFRPHLLCSLRCCLDIHRLLTKLRGSNGLTAAKHLADLMTREEWVPATGAFAGLLLSARGLIKGSRGVYRLVNERGQRHRGVYRSMTRVPATGVFAGITQRHRTV